MSSTNQKGISLSNLKNGRFDESILKAYYKNKEEIWEKTHPQYFDQDGLVFHGFELVNLADIEKNTGGYDQNARSAGMNKHLPVIRNLIEENGWNTKFLPPAILRDGNNNTILTGNTRCEVASLEDAENIPCIVYNIDSNSSIPTEVIISRAGQNFQEENTGGNPSSSDDLTSQLRHRIDKGIILSKDTDALMEELEILNRTAKFTKKTLKRILERARSMDCPNAIGYGEDRYTLKPDDVMRNQMNLKDSTVFKDDGSPVVTNYIMSAANTWDKTFNKALLMCANDRHAEVRICLHTSILTGKDKQECYEKAIRKFWAEFKNFRLVIMTVTGMSRRDFDRRIKVYGALPALKKIQDINSMVLFHQKNEEAFQKNNGYSFSLV